MQALIMAMPDGQLQRGSSLIIAPDARNLTQAGSDAALLTATVALAERDEALAALDSDGHYSRPDVFELTINTAAQDGVLWRQRLPTM
ncbi:MAG: hypothetical protein U5J78_03880 [Parasphingorhabdus sp.]|nr:hypothetical protein [Parasphingorhabdus sp.]